MESIVKHPVACNTFLTCHFTCKFHISFKLIILTLLWKYELGSLGENQAQSSVILKRASALVRRYEGTMAIAWVNRSPGRLQARLPCHPHQLWT